MLKRVFSAVVGVACMMSMTSAFALTYDATRTEYHAANQIKVTSTVTGAKDEVATYLVYNKDRANAEAIVDGDDIIYVDQYKFTEAGSYEFEYVTASGNIGSKIQVGNGATNPSGAPAAIPGITYPVTVTDGTTNWTTNAYTDAAENSWYKIPFATQSIVKEVTVGTTKLTDDQWFTAVNAIWISDTVEFSKEGNTVNVVVEAAAPSATTISMAYFASEDASVDGETGASVVAVGQVQGNSEDFGIILGASPEAIKECIEAMNAEGSAYTGADAFKPGEISASALPSYGKNSEGKFAIRVYDETFAGAVYAATYFKNAEGKYELSDNCKTLNIV